MVGDVIAGYWNIGNFYFVIIFFFNGGIFYMYHFTVKINNRTLFILKNERKTLKENQI